MEQCKENSDKIKRGSFMKKLNYVTYLIIFTLLIANLSCFSVQTSANEQEQARIFTDIPAVDQSEDSSWMLPAQAGRPGKIQILYSKLSTSGTLSLKWAADENAEGYRIEYAQNSEFTNSVSRYVSGQDSTEAEINDLNIRKRYYVRICGYYLSRDAQRVFGYWSNEKSVAVPGLKTDQTISVKTSFTKSFKTNAKFSLSASAYGKLYYSSSNTSVVYVSSGGTVTLKGCGTATITVNAAETSKYNKATKKVTVKVLPAQVKNLSAKSTASKKISFSWTRDKYVDGYEIQISSSPSFPSSTAKTKTGRTKQNTINKGSMGGFKSGLRYYVRVRSYKTTGKTQYSGSWSSVKTIIVK